MDRVILLADHVIGYRLTEYLINEQLLTAGVFKIEMVFGNQPDKNAWWPSLQNLAVARNIPYEHYTPERFQTAVQNSGCNLILLFSWKHILPGTLLQAIHSDIVNLHYSLLPLHRGVYPVNWAIQSGDTETGITFHFVDGSIDGGKIIEQKKLPIDICDDAKSLLSKLDDLAYSTFLDMWVVRREWHAMSYSQQALFTYHSRKDFNYSNKIDLNNNLPAKHLLDLLRAKTFGDKGAAYFVDPATGRKITVTIHLSAANENSI